MQSPCVHDCVSFVPLVSALVPLVSALIVELSLSSTEDESLCMLTRRGKQKKGLTVLTAGLTVLCAVLILPIHHGHFNEG